MKQTSIFGIPRKDIIGIRIHTVPKEAYKTENMTQILNSVNKAMKKYGFMDIDIFTDSSTFTISFNSDSDSDSDIEIEEEREEEGKYTSKYVNTYSKEEETSKDFSPSKHTSAFFQFFGF